MDDDNVLYETILGFQSDPMHPIQHMQGYLLYNCG